MAQQQFQHHSPDSQNQRFHPQQRSTTREEFLWRRKLDLEEQAFDTIARINALQDKLVLIGDRKKEIKQQLLDVQARLQQSPLLAVLVPRPRPDLRLLESQVKRLVEEEEKTKADLFLANHSLDSLNAKIANLEFELSQL